MKEKLDAPTGLLCQGKVQCVCVGGVCVCGVRACFSLPGIRGLSRAWQTLRQTLGSPAATNTHTHTLSHRPSWPISLCAVEGGWNSTHPELKCSEGLGRGVSCYREVEECTDTAQLATRTHIPTPPLELCSARLQPELFVIMENRSRERHL